METPMVRARINKTKRLGDTSLVGTCGTCGLRYKLTQSEGDDRIKYVVRVMCNHMHKKFFRDGKFKVEWGE